MAPPATGALGPGGSQVLTVPSSATWVNYTASYVCSSTADTAANAWLEGSADGGTTFFPLTPSRGTLPSQSAAGAGSRVYLSQPVNAVKVHVQCTSGNTVTVTVTGE